MNLNRPVLSTVLALAVVLAALLFLTLGADWSISYVFHRGMMVETSPFRSRRSTKLLVFGLRDAFLDSRIRYQPHDGNQNVTGSRDPWFGEGEGNGCGVNGDGEFSFLVASNRRCQG